MRLDAALIQTSVAKLRWFVDIECVMSIEGAGFIEWGSLVLTPPVSGGRSAGTARGPMSSREAWYASLSVCEKCVCLLPVRCLPLGAFELRDCCSRVPL